MSYGSVFSWVALCSLALSACGKATHETAHDELTAHSHGVNQVVPGVWPPVLVNIDNQRLISTSRRSRGSSVLIAAARNSVLNNPVLLTQLGDNFAVLEESMGDDKSGIVASFLFYNYSTDQTIAVVLLSNGSINQTIYSASEFQPAENADEIRTAISLASETMRQDGVDINSLIGTAMLAFPAISQPLDVEAQRFYSQRLLYVTFGEGDGIEPKYQALVNVSQKRVVEHGEIR